MPYHGESTGGGGQQPTEEQLDTIFELLADSRRRFVLAYLRDREWATVRELTDVVTGWEAAERKRGFAIKKDRNRIRAWLHHATIPKLEDAGVVTCDLGTGRVRLVDLPPPMEIVLEIAVNGQWDDEQPDRHPTGTRRRRRR